MEKQNLSRLIDDIFIPIGFKRKGNNWVCNHNEISKIINLQKSNYGNLFYINYGYNIKNLELTTRVHVDNRLASSLKEEQKKITDLLDLENDITDNKRISDLRYIIENIIVSELTLIYTEKDLLNYLKNRSNLNNIPLIVKIYFNLGG